MGVSKSVIPNLKAVLIFRLGLKISSFALRLSLSSKAVSLKGDGNYIGASS